VGTLLGVPAARGLFHRAILQSGAGSHLLSREDGAKAASELISELGLQGDVVAALREVPVDRLLAAQTAVTMRHEGLVLRPVIDGVTLSDPPLDAVGGGSTQGVDVLLGTTADEMTLLNQFNPHLADVDDAKARRRIDSLAGAAAHDVVAAYGRTRGQLSPRDLLVAAQTDAVFRIPAIRLAERHSATGQRAYMYLFSWCTPAFGGSLRACHALEIPFVFDNLDKPGAEMFTGDGDDRAELATRMHRAWLAFARTGDPDHDGLPHWPPYTAERRATMVFDRECRVEDDPLADERRAWETVELTLV